jgi:NhaA family Na+:H+ antiporter
MTANNKPASARIIEFINHEATAGLILVAAAALAMFVANTGLQSYSDQFFNTRVNVSAGQFGLSKPLFLWINDGLMAVFFFLVGLEIKREVLEGNLSNREQILLPAAAAIGGMLVPALVYTSINWGNSELLQGWAITAATDIAFALGALALVGSRAPPALKVFLLTLATLDDLGAIIAIALFYTAKLSWLALIGAGLGLFILLALNRIGVIRTAPYIFTGIIVWVLVLKSGIHATLAGVAVGFTIPLKRKDGSSLIHDLEEGLHPYIKFFILPLFAFANAGISFEGMGLGSLTEPVALGISAGLVVGKPAGILLAVAATVLSGLASLPAETNWRHIFGVACLAGIGFTMSLFIGMLAFEETPHITGVRIGVIAGSLISTAIGLALLMSGPARKKA